jgi:glyoxylase-like metal-dependent hydrolase (beta-lactamase superfamily II)
MFTNYVSLFVATLLIAALPQDKQPQTVAANFEVQKLAEGVYAVIRKDPPGLMVDANSVFIINDDDVVVVDTSGAPETSRAVLAALRRLTNKPVKYLVNTHWHDDHIRGNRVFRDAFPSVEFIAHSDMREYMPDQGAANRKGFLEGAPPVVAQMRSLLEKNKNFSGATLTEEERESYSSDIKLAELAIGGAPEGVTVLPTMALQDRLTLYRGDRRIDIRHLGKGHTSGDIVVHLPKEGIVITGDLVVWPVPLVGNPQSHIGDWAVTLEKVIALGASTIVPGHGPVMHNDSHLKLMANMFASIKRQTDAAVTRGETLEQARQSVNLDEFRKQMAGDSPVRRALFNGYVAGPGIAAAFREASSKK